MHVSLPIGSSVLMGSDSGRASHCLAQTMKTKLLLALGVLGTLRACCSSGARPGRTRSPTRLTVRERWRASGVGSGMARLPRSRSSSRCSRTGCTSTRCTITEAGTISASSSAPRWCLAVRAAVRHGGGNTAASPKSNVSTAACDHPNRSRSRQRVRPSERGRFGDHPRQQHPSCCYAWTPYPWVVAPDSARREQ